MNVLIVDDKQTSSRLKDEFEMLGVKCATAIDFPNAMMQYNQKKPDAIISDVPLPQSCGFEFAAYVRSKDELTPILFHTHLVDRRALNLSIWLGADAYLTKPASAQRLLDAINESAQSKSIQRRVELGDNQTLHFRCMCGADMQARKAHLGKHIPCRNCGRTVQAPESKYILEGNWVSSDAKSGRDLAIPGFRCQSCNKYLNPLHAKRNGDCRCANCDEITRLPTWVLRRQKIYNKYLEKDNTIPFEAKPKSSLIQLQCPVCNTYYQYDLDSKGQSICSFCHTQFTVNSLRNSPMAKVQLLACGRYGMIKKCPANRNLERKSFLIPRGKRIDIGGASTCQIQLIDSNLNEVECQLICDRDDTMYCQPHNGSHVTINGEPLTGQTVLKGKSDIQMGGTMICIYASGKTSENNRIRKGIKKYFKFSEDQFYGHNALLIESACILYDYWSTN